MLARDFKRVVLIVVPILLIIYVAIRCLDFRNSSTGLSHWYDHVFAPNWRQNDELKPHEQLLPSGSATQPQGMVAVKPHESAGETHHEIFSTSTVDKKFSHIHFGQDETINPNVLPHPNLENTFIVVAQKRKLNDNSAEHLELVCNAVFTLGGLACVQPQSILPIAATKSGDGKCPPKLAYIALNVGPHDARVFYGPKHPFIVFGSNSRFACFGQFIQDFRTLGDWGFALPLDSNFSNGTELQRPPPWGIMEKNWFVFWDEDGAAYIHQDVAPKRVFAKLNTDGSVGPDLAPLAVGDEACLSKYMPKLAPDLESIHQATNSLSISFCKRSDPTCKATGDNTFLFTVFQHKTFYRFHGEYEPYVMVFRQKAPFEVFAVSKRPIWIHGREKRLDGGSDMFYVTSMSWKRKDQRYHGFLDDELFLSFGIEDQQSGAIDVLAMDLLAELGTCL
ncbi:hypothetical protein LY78DRAFT_662921 [Colletotrichum sublineola]|uniref:Uncharacterized protein n=1 Tax=Colletotrichum sublineola TaxID=1173701 RepID=A0A066XB28_COLSU|nr:hypothetical protein LY78DRAFT_662921 [Colletotrichum sublineola]KDN62971.1 hypothetical protein CSUB01_10954 [Colletotrichum sublineola]